MGCCAFGLDLFEPGIVKYLGKRCVPGVCERIRPTLATVRDESPNGHGLHIPRRNSDCGVIDPGRGAEQDHSVPCSEFFSHCLLPPPAPGECRYGSLACRLVAGTICCVSEQKKSPAGAGQV